MDDSFGKPFFDKIRQNIKVAYFVASIIPLGLLVYLSLKYVLPVVSKGDFSALPLHIGVLLFLAVVLSLLGLTLSVKTTNNSISALQSLHNRLNSLIEITKHFRETIYVDILLEDILKSATNLISVKTGSLLLIDEDGSLKYKVAIGEKADSIKDRSIRIGEGFAGRVIKTGEPLLINDVARDNPDKMTEEGLGINIHSVLCVPLISNKRVIGVIELLNKRQGTFSREDERMLFSLADQAAISITQSKQLETRHSDIIHITDMLLSALDCYSPDKDGHAKRVARYANLIGKRMGLSDDLLKNLYYASLFHDIGFLKIPSKDRGVRERILQHPKLGYDMIRPISLWTDVAEIILYHHEWYDGNGYPTGVKEKDIPLSSRIISVADTFDVLTSKHSYKEPLDPDTAVREIETNAGTQFDPEVVNVLTKIIREVDIG
ncbi:MAG: HD-GYP domain-containing protein [Thermodesulfovibrionia bacterium]